MKQKKPSKGSVLGIWAGASPASAQNLKKGLARLQKLGWTARIPPETRKHMARAESTARPFLAGPDRAKVKSLLSLWKAPDIQDIFCVRGGYGTLRLLPLLDKATLPSKKIRLWGYSDLTVIQNYLFQRCRLPWIHSSMLTGDSFFHPNKAEKKAWESLSQGQAPQSSYKLKVLFRPSGHKAPRQPLLMIGGNLACLVSMIGTPWEPTPRAPFLLFLEDTHEPGYKLDRLLQQLGSSKLMKNCRGIVLGHFTECAQWKQIIRLWAEENRILTLYGVPAGHEAPNLPLPLGNSVRLELKKRGVGILQVPNLFLR